MKSFLKTLLTLVLWIVLIALVLLGLYILHSAFDISPMVLGAASLGLIALILLSVYIKRRLTLRKRRKQIQHIVSLDSEALPIHSQSNQIIENRWNRAISIMRESYLGRSGNPIYALPWYMVMGKTGAGKSSSIEHSGLSSMKTDIGSENTHTSTLNCNWFFFREALVMDTAGRYTVPLNEEEDAAEWQEFLTRLAKYRRNEALNGLVIACSADTLYGNGSHLLADARCIRRRIDEIMRILGAKFPVYLMVTKFDLLSGVGKVLENLPDDLRKVCMGELIQNPENKHLVPMDVQINEALQNLCRKWQQFFLFADPETLAKNKETSHYRVLAFEEFKAILPALAAYTNEIFADNPYQETPDLRGIFFSSALRGPQKALCSFSKLAKLIQKIFRTKERLGGIFLHDFYNKVLPQDRNLNRPIAEYLRWKSSMRNLAYGGFLALALCFGILFNYTYQHDVQILRMIDDLINSDSSLNIKTTKERLDRLYDDQGSLHIAPSDPAVLTQRLIDYERLYHEEVLIEKALNKNPIIKLFGALSYGYAQKAFETLSESLNNVFVQEIIIPSVPGLSKLRAKLNEESDDKEFFLYTANLIWYYDLYSAKKQGKSFEEMLKIPAMPQAIIEALGIGNTPITRSAMAYCIVRSIYSLDDTEEVDRSLRNVQNLIKNLPKIKNQSLEWVVQRAGELSSLSAVNASRFWFDANKIPMQSIKLNPIYTIEGFKKTLGYLENLRLILSAESDNEAFNEFLDWYLESYLNAWRHFALAMSQEAKKLATRPQTSNSLSHMGTDDNPFFELILYMHTELEAIRPYLHEVPTWMENLDVMARAIYVVRKESPRKQELGILEELKIKTQSLISDVSSNLDTKMRLHNLKAESLAKDVQAYLKALADLVPAGQDEALAFTAVKDALPSESNPKHNEAPINLAFTAFTSMNVALDPAINPASPLYQLMFGSLDFFTRRLVNESSCHIQSMWEGDVLASAGRLSTSQLQQSLFNEQSGLVRNFINKSLGNFFDHTINGYAPETLHKAYPMSFTDDFLAFINVGLADYKPVSSEYGITIEALPVNVNEDAFELPQSVSLSLQCTEEKQSLENYNSPASKLFAWKANSCGDTSLTIRFKTTELKVNYMGQNGFINFLNDFQFGSKTFSASDFPYQEEQLKKMGVDSITVRYNIQDAASMLESYTFSPGQIPFIAAECTR